MAETTPSSPTIEPLKQPDSVEAAPDAIEPFKGTVIEHKTEANASALDSRAKALSGIIEFGIFPREISDKLGDPHFLEDVKSDQQERRLIPDKYLSEERNVQTQEMLKKILDGGPDNPIKKLFSDDEMSQDDLVSMKIIGAGLLQEYPPTTDKWEQGDEKFKTAARLAQTIVRGVEMKALENMIKQNASLSKETVKQQMKHMATWIPSRDLPKLVVNKMVQVGDSLGAKYGVMVTKRDRLVKNKEEEVKPIVAEIVPETSKAAEAVIDAAKPEENVYSLHEEPKEEAPIIAEAVTEAVAPIMAEVVAEQKPPEEVAEQNPYPPSSTGEFNSNDPNVIDLKQNKKTGGYEYKKSGWLSRMKSFLGKFWGGEI